MKRNVLILALGVFAWGATACENQTTHALCNEENALTGVPGITGDYVLTTQNSDFDAVVSNIRVFAEESAAKVMALGVDEQVSLCQWTNGWIVSQSQDEETGLYSYSRLSITGQGIGSQSVFFNRQGLEEANVPYEIIEKVPVASSLLFKGLEQSVRSMHGTAAVENRALVVNNADVPWREVVAHAHTPFVSIVLQRQ